MRYVQGLQWLRTSDCVVAPTRPNNCGNAVREIQSRFALLLVYPVKLLDTRSQTTHHDRGDLTPCSAWMTADKVRGVGTAVRISEGCGSRIQSPPPIDARLKDPDESERCFANITASRVNAWANASMGLRGGLSIIPMSCGIANRVLLRVVAPLESSSKGRRLGLNGERGGAGAARESNAGIPTGWGISLTGNSNS